MIFAVDHAYPPWRRTPAAWHFHTGDIIYPTGWNRWLRFGLCL